MDKEMKHLHQDIEDIKKSIEFIKHILAEDYELSDEAKKQLAIADKTPLSEYVDHADVKKELLE